MIQTATILARRFFADSHAKTAHGLIRHGRKYKIRSVIDETLKGSDAGEVMGLGHMGIPIVDEVDTKAEVLIIGVAPSGGQLPRAWRDDIVKAIENRMEVVSGLHDFLNDDLELAALANKYDVKLVDLRKPPKEMYIAKHIKPTIPVLLVCGTDAACGKRTTALELYYMAKDRSINAGFLATGQTGMMIGCDAGIVVDHLPTDFVAGAVEHAVQNVIKQGKELVIVEGQGAILHHAYSTSAIGILHGACPTFIILVHPALRRQRSSFPMVPIPPPENEIRALEQLSPGTKVIALSLNCGDAKNYHELCKKFQNKIGLLTVDVLKNRSGVDILLEKVIAEIKTKN